AWNSLTVRDASGDEIATSSNNTYFYFNPGSYDSNPITMEFYASGATEPNRTATIITKDFETSQSGSFTGAVDVSWARPWGDFKDCSTRLTWSTATSSTVLNSGANEGSCTFDASQLPDGPGVLTLEYVDALGNVVGTVSVDAIVLNAGALVVDTADDTVNAYDSKTSLLEAVAYAEAFGIEAPITFAPGLAGQTVRVNGALRLSSAHIDAGATGVAIRADSVVVSGDSSIANTRLITNALTVSAPLAMTGATLEFTGDSAAVNATAALTSENLTVAGADSTWRVTNASRFINPTFNSDAAFTNGSVLTLEGALTANGNVLLSNASISTSGNAAIAGTGAVSFSGNSNDAINVAGTEDAPATLTVAPGATLQGAGKITGQYLTTVVSGTFAPVGNFALAGDFELAVDGSLVFGVASLTNYPRLSISGPATVRGEVVLERLSNGFVPTSQNTFAVLQASALDVLPSATFDTETMNALAQIAEEISNDSLVFTVGWVSGPKVVSVAPLDNYSTGASKTYFDVYFNQPIDASSFTASDVAVKTQQGASVAVENPQSLNSNGTAFRVYFAEDARANQTYTVEIGPDVRNRNGIAMNQDGAEPNGAASDKFSGSFAIATPDLALSVASGAIPATGELGTQMEFAYTVTNSGSVDAIGGWADKVYLSKDAVLSEGDYLLKTVADGASSAYSVGLAVGESVTKTARFVLPLDASEWTSGDYYIIVAVDADSAVYETSETNNLFVSGKIALSYPPLSDLQVSSVTAPSTAAAGGLVELVWDELNAGARTVAEVRRDAIYISTDGTLENATLLKTVRRTDTLSAGESVRRRETVTVPSTGYYGSVRFIVVSDFENAVPEGNETNNSGVSSAPTALAQSLGLSFSASEVNEGTANVRGTVTRTGDLSQPLTVSIASSDTTELTVSESVTIPAGQASASFYYSAVKDDE
ncbi:MAG: Ig-like domain-containing protein, partial [Thermoguttaceae bacterium]|nr:Ig-like domain-containing protein [Thermoguttaceae bacterium]